MAILVATCAITGCRESGRPEPDAGHAHVAPHGGTAVELGDHEYNLELVLDPRSGTFRGYILDAHMENAVRIEQESFEVAATLPGGEEKALVFRAVGSGATGETVGDTSYFEAQVNWVSETFRGVLKEISVGGKKYEMISFEFPPEEL